MEGTDRESWRRVGSSFDAAAFHRKQDQAVSSDRERRDAAFLEAAEALLGDDDTSSEGSVRASPTDEPRHGSGRKRHHGERKSKHKSKKKEKKRRHRDDAYDRELQNIIAAERSAGVSARKPQVPQWLAVGKELPSAAGYYFDTRGDPGNLAFGELYRGDVAAYRRFDPGGFVARQAGASDRDSSTVRYFSAPVARALRRRNIEPWRPSQDYQQARGKPGALQAAAPSFLPFSPSVDNDTADVHEKSIAQKLSTAKTIAFNIRAREHPEDLQNWLDFAAFQDELAREQGVGKGTKGASDRSTAEKKIAILEAALRFHSSSDALLLALLEAARPLCDDRELSRRWQNILKQHPGSPLLWRAYLSWCSRRSFAGFAVHELSTLYGQAVTALGQEIAARKRHGTPAGIMEPLERETVALALQGILFLREAGLTEWFVAAIQTTLEYHYFAPKDWDEEARQTMFEDFWLSGAPFIGELGAQGWSAWLDSIQRRPAEMSEHIQKVEESTVQRDSSETGAGKWAGWEDLAPAIRAKFGHRLDMSTTEDLAESSAGHELKDTNDATGGPEADSDLSDVDAEHDQEEESEEALLERLGLELEAALEDKQAITDDVVLDWLEMEREQTRAQWKPVRLSDTELSRRLEESENESSVMQLDRLIPWSRVSHLMLLPVTSATARQELLLGVLELLGAPLPELSLSSSCPAQRAITAIQDAFEPYPLAQEVASEEPSVFGKLQSSSEPWYLQNPGRSDFLVRLLRTLVEENDLSGGSLESAAGDHEEQSNNNGHLLPSDCRRSMCQTLLQAVAQAQGFDAARSLAKELLSRRRNDVDLWEALMLIEWRAGKIKTARKVAYACLSSRSLVPLSLDEPYACLLLSVVQLECGVTWTAHGILHPLPFGLSQAQHCAALRLLAWYGSAGGVALLDHTGGAQPVPLSDSAEMAARRGYQALLGEVSATRQGDLSTRSVAAVAAAASFEVLSRGRSVTAGLRVLDGFLESTFSAIIMPKDAFATADSTATLLEQLRHQMQHRKQADLSGATCPSAAVEMLAVMRAELAISAAELSPPALPPIQAASHVLASLLPAFPDSPCALRLLPRVAALGVGLTRVRATLRALLDMPPASSGSSPLVSDAVVRLEAVVGGPLGVVRRAAEASLRRPVCEHWPAGWRALLCLGRAQIRQAPDLRRSVLRAITACPWVKDLWIDGLRALVGHVPAQELAELIDAMREKQVSVRTDLLEAVLKRM